MPTLNIELLESKLKENFNENILSSDKDADMFTIVVTKESYHDVVRFLKEDAYFNFHYLTTLCGLHYPDSPFPFGLMVQLHNMPENSRIRIKTFTGDNEPTFKTLTDLWPAANWMERETYDFFGFKFTGHPDLRRILNMDSLEGWPMRKEYPLEDPFRKDKDDKMFGR